MKMRAVDVKANLNGHDFDVDPSYKLNEGEAKVCLDAVKLQCPTYPVNKDGHKKCPNCESYQIEYKGSVIEFNPSMIYCPYCGQKLKWTYDNNYE